MRLLLDTHIWLWGLLAPGLLVPSVARELESLENEIWLSPISTWEALILVERGRIVVDGDPGKWIDEMVTALPQREAPVTHEVAVESRRLALPHQDPADRFLAATAKVYDLTLVTGDERLLQSREISFLANR